MSDLTDMLEDAIRYGIEVEADFYGGGQDADKFIVAPAQAIAAKRRGVYFTVDSLAAALVEVEESKLDPRCIADQCDHGDDDPRCMDTSLGCGDAAAIIKAAKEASVSDPRTSVWMVDFEVTPIEMHGHEWPDVLVQKWERNEIGERRFVESRIYSANIIKAAKEASDEW